ncbi:MAG: alpha/beta fold hydrolase [Pseudomonadota bacterium]
MRRTSLLAATLLLAGLALYALTVLEGARAGVSVARVTLGPAPAVVMRPAGEPEGLVVIGHGFAGSHAFMQAIGLTLARAGRTVVAFDFPGHGRNAEPLSADVTREEGTTQQLVAQSLAVIDAAQALTGAETVDLLGHSMATDVLIRAAAERRDVDAVVAVSMYSEAVTPTAPARLLILSGAWEPRLRAVALDAVRQLDPRAEEGDTVVAGNTARRAVAAPGVEHVGVLYDPVTLTEAAAWIAPGKTVDPVRIGPAVLMLLAALLALYWPLSRLLPARAPAPLRLTARHFVLILAAPALPAFAAATLVGERLPGALGFGRLAVFAAVWGGVQLFLLWRAGWRPARPGLWGIALLLVWGLGAVAPALDRYVSSFLPMGPRFALMLMLGLGTLPLMLADAWLTYGQKIWRRVLARLVLLATLATAMLVDPFGFGLLFTVLPVGVLFILVYGLMGRWTAQRMGPETAGLALGVALAFAVASSQPLFAGG